MRRSWLLGHGLCERWLPTPRPLAMFHHYRAKLLPAEGYLLTEKVAYAVGLPEAVRACRAPGVLRAWSERLARVVRAMHDRGVSHRDLKAPNVMLRGAASDPATATPVLIDLVGVRAGFDAVPFARRARTRLQSARPRSTRPTRPARDRSRRNSPLVLVSRARGRRGKRPRHVISRENVTHEAPILTRGGNGGTLPCRRDSGVC